MVASITTNLMGSSTNSATTTQRPALDRNAFLQLLVAQISHQDPLQPMEGTEFVTQLAQFSIVEQSIAQSSKLDVLSTQLRGLSYNEASTLVGRSVTIRGHGIAYDGTTATGASVTLPEPVSAVTVTIRDASGTAVRTMQMGPHAAGTLAVAWDGRDNNGQHVPAGGYTVDVSATKADGSSVAVSQDVTGVVQRVSYDKGYAELLLDSGATAPISDLVSVGATPASR
ncbi:MAG: FlgD immunoglobulin-like domain containing protein [Deltaproteobacteria bacterium]